MFPKNRKRAAAEHFNQACDLIIFCSGPVNFSQK